MENPWFMIAVVEFFILLVVLAPTVASLTRGKKANDQERKIKLNDDEGQKGTIKNLRLVTRGVGGIGGIATIFEIQKSDGIIFYAGAFGNDHALSEGAFIEFWPSPETIVLTTIDRSKENEDGTKSTWQETIKYYQLTKFRTIQDESELPVSETTMEACAS